MSSDTVPIPAHHAPDPGKVRPLSLCDLDRRTVAYRNAERLMSNLLVDLGGEDHASAGQRELARRAAVMGAMIEDTETRYLRGEQIDLASYLAAVNAHRRVLATIGLERIARNVTPDPLAYARQRAGEAAA